MNTPGMSSYSKETVGLRQPIQIKDQQFRLIYVYPMLFADVLTRQDVKDNLRSFLSISFLREIFVSNSLNIIQMASQMPAVNQNQEQSRVAQLIGNAVLGSGRHTNTQMPDFDRFPNYTSSDTYELQNRVEKKTNQILKYLLTDTRTKKLNPQIEIVTLNNLIDVPVIVGTKHYDVPTYPLIYVLLIAVATNTPLDRYSNIDKIVRVLKKTREKDWVTLLSRFADTEDELKGFAKWADDHPDFRGRTQLSKWSKSIAKFLRLTKEDDDTPEERDLAGQKEYDTKEVTDLFNMLKLVKNSLNDLSLYFKFVLEPSMLRQQIGLDLSNNTMETTVMKVSSNQYQIFMVMHDKFMELISIPGSIFLSSVFNTLFPMPTESDLIFQTDARGDFVLDANDDKIPINRGYQDSHNLNFLELKEKHFDVGLNKKIQKLIFDTFVTEIKNSMSQYSPTEAQEKTKLLKKVCESMSQVDSTFSDAVEKFVSKDDNVITSVNFDMEDVNNFTASINTFSASLLSQNKRFENIFSQLVSNGKSILKIVQTQIYSSIEDFMRDIYTSGGSRYVSAMEYILDGRVDGDDVKRTYIPQMTDTLFTIFYFFFLYRLQSAICNYIEVLDVEIESAVNDVIDFPNYTLVITTDVVKAVYTAYIAANLNRLLTGDQMYQAQKITQNHIKGMMKFLCRKMKIPSLVVYDEQRNEYFYQFMFMSAPEKLSGNALESFIKANNIKKY